MKKMKKMDVIIIGAPRSGTNMLRDVLTSLPGTCTWPCDEINYIWRHGNIGYPSDDIPISLLKENIREYILKQFDKIRVKYDSQIVIEKTCANTLRIPFVDKVLPEAKYINIIRDGIDATGSAKLRWKSKVDIKYIFKKVQYVPLVDLPFYATRYIWSRMYKFFSKQKRLAFWGPIFNDIDDILKEHSLDEVCAIQWQRCVEASEEILSTMPEDKVLHLRYENFVTKPFEELSRIVNFLGIEVSDIELQCSVQNVSSKSLGKGRMALGNDKCQELELLIGDTLKRLGY